MNQMEPRQAISVLAALVNRAPILPTEQFSAQAAIWSLEALISEKEKAEQAAKNQATAEETQS